MLVVALCVIAVISPLVVGKWPAGLIARTWRMPWLIWATLVFQVIVLEVPMNPTVAAVLHVATYASTLAFIWFNRAVAGLWVIGAGAGLNGLVIALNGGTLPANPAAVEAAGREHSMAFANSSVVENPVLPWLGDYFAWPAPMPLANTFSIGDVLIVTGVATVAWIGAKRFGAAADGQAKQAQASSKSEQGA